MYVSRQKTTYQRNMLIGQGVALGLSLLIAIYLRLLLPVGASDSSIEKVSVARFGRFDLGQSIERLPGADRSGGTGASSLQLPYGVNPQIVSNLTQSLRLELDDLPYGDPEGTAEDGFWSIPGEDAGCFQAEGGEFVSQFEAPPELLTRDVGLIEARRPEYPLVAMDRGLEGEVELLLCIDSLGYQVPFPVRSESGESRVVDHLVLSESPTDWFFARNSVRAVKAWVFAPAVENGRVVSSFLKVRIRFNLADDSDWLILESR